MKETLTDENFNRLKDMLVEHVLAETNGVSDLHSKLDGTNERIDSLMAKLEPMIDTYTNARGFYNTFTWFLKFLGLLAAGLGALFFFKKL